METLYDLEQTAQKPYVCDACWAWMRSGYGERDVTPQQWAVVQKAKAERWMILPGQRYRKVVYKDGDLMTYRARLDMDALASELELFDEC